MTTKIHLPCWRYSAAGPILVTSQDALDKLGPEWVDSPAKVPQPEAPKVERPTLIANVAPDWLSKRVMKQQKKAKP